MNREEALMVWAPRNSLWGAWTKPVLFSFMSDPLPEQSDLVDLGWNAVVSGDVAILLESPGAEAVISGLQLARFGYRPIPVFNASPFGPDDFGTTEFKPETTGPHPLVEIMSIMRAMERNTIVLNALNLPESAPPAFLIDANRSKGPRFPGAGVFDNRSIVRESDFPSGEALKNAGIRRVVLFRSAEGLSRDLLSVLLAWQNDGLQIQTQKYGEEWNPVNYTVKRRGALSILLDRLLAWLAFRTNSRGSFGRIIHSAGG